MIYDDSGDCMDCRGWEKEVERLQATIDDLQRDEDSSDKLIGQTDYANERLAVEKAKLKETVTELLDALESLMDEERRDRIMPIGAAWDKARAAIAKATGKDQPQ